MYYRNKDLSILCKIKQKINKRENKPKTDEHKKSENGPEVQKDSEMD